MMIWSKDFRNQATALVAKEKQKLQGSYELWYLHCDAHAGARSTDRQDTRSVFRGMHSRYPPGDPERPAPNLIDVLGDLT